jgi:hypothetical protein
MGLGAFGGQALTCVRPCLTTADCARSAQSLHVPLSCRPTTEGPRCLPILPSLSACNDDTDCFGRLVCRATAVSGKVCTKSCNTSDDCASEAALGSAFSCVKGMCVSKIVSGCPAASDDLCLSGRRDGSGACVSPSDWACTADGQCQSGSCALIEGTNPLFGRCQ